MTEAPDNSQAIQEWLAHLNQVLSAYHFESFIARGGMGYVFKAWQKSLERSVAVKIMSRRYGSDEHFRASFATEAKAMARLNHPNLIGVYDFGQVDDMPYIVMEYVAGSSLHDAAVDRKIDPQAAVRIIRGMCAGLIHAHDNGVIHRDIKPANILLTADGQPKIGDFGLARQLGTASEGVLMGTPGYIAPEVFLHQDSADRRSDIFSVGTILYQLLSGREPAATSAVSSGLVDCPSALLPICQQAMHPDPNRRYQDARALDRALLNWQTLQASPATTGPMAGITRRLLAGSAGRKPAATLPNSGARGGLARSPSGRSRGGGNHGRQLLQLLLIGAAIGSIPFTYKALQLRRNAGAAPVPPVSANPVTNPPVTNPPATSQPAKPMLDPRQAAVPPSALPISPASKPTPPPITSLRPPQPQPRRNDPLTTRQEPRQTPAEMQSSTASESAAKAQLDESMAKLIDALEPLKTPDLQRAQLAYENLKILAATQSGATRSETERLKGIIGTLSAAEIRISAAVKKRKQAESEATSHDAAAKAWQTPNRFGFVNQQAVAENLNEAKQLRQDAAQGIADAHKNLDKQLGDMTSVIDSYVKLQQPDIAGILTEMCKAVKSRTPPKSG